MKLRGKTNLWKHQEIARKEALNRSYGLFMDVGTGKTLTTIAILSDIYEKSPNLRTLILCPPVVMQNWKREIQQYAEINSSFVVVLEGTRKKRLDLLNQGLTRGAYIFITNYETLLMDPVFNILQAKMNIGVYDEVHRCKNFQAKRTKLAIKLAANQFRRFILTGSPILNAPTDLFTQFLILDHGESFGKNFYEFRAKFMQDKNAMMPSHKYFPNWQPRKDKFEDLQKTISRSAAVVKKHACLDLPPLVRKTIEVPMSAEQFKVYHSMKKSLVAALNEGKFAVADLAITKTLRLQQIVSGFVVDDSGDVHRFKENPRADALYEILEDLVEGHKVIVWAVFKENYEAIRVVCRRLGVEWAEVHGEISDKQSNIDAFNNNEKCRVLIGHPQSGGIGINLTVSDVSIWFSRGFSLEQEIQAEARNYRGGSERHESITRFDLFANETIDEIVMKRLASKQTLSKEIIVEMLRS